MDRGTDGDGAVGDDGEIHAGRYRALDLWNFRADLADDVDHVGAGLTLDVDDHGRRALIPAAGAVVLEAVDNLRDVGDGDGRAVTVGDDNRLVGFGGGDLVVGG